MLVEEKALFGVVAQRTYVGVALKTGDGHSLVRNDLHQNQVLVGRPPWDKERPLARRAVEVEA